jgi:hypothetical protein
MRNNPAGDWAIEDVIAVCKANGINCTAPRGGGSHYKISHPGQQDILTVPFRRPIKPVYIRRLVRFIEAVGAINGQP